MRLLVIRTSAMGDVALTTPVLRAMRLQYPDIEIVLLTRPAFKPFFATIEGLKLFFPDLKNKHKGLTGIIRLFKDLQNSGKFNAVVDLHDVLRSKILRLLFILAGVPSYVIDKGRRDKRRVITGKKKVRLKHSVERYSEVFAEAGFPLTLSPGPWIIPSSESLTESGLLAFDNEEINIGVAPYAKHKLKMWPEEYMIRLLGLISGKHNTRFWLFGGNEDTERLELFQARIPGSVNTAGKLDLTQELALMSKLSFMIAMDSSNMHMAALVGTKIISIWGGTDPLSGFGAWMQPEDFSLGTSHEELTCRPCTTYGKGECRRGDFACMNWLTPEIVFKKMEKLKLF